MLTYDLMPNHWHFVVNPDDLNRRLKTGDTIEPSGGKQAISAPVVYSRSISNTLGTMRSKTQ